MPVSFPTSSFAEFSPNSLFAAGEPGVWFDPSEVADLKWRRNLLTYTEQFDNAVWAKYSSVTGSGLQVREIATNSEHYIEQIVSLSGSVTATFEVQSVGRDVIRLAIGTSSPIYGVLYTFSTGSLSSLGSAITEATGTNLGDGYHRIVLKSSSGANRLRIQLTDSGTASYLGDVTKGINARKLQLEVGSTATEYQRISDVHTEVRALYPRATLYQDTAGNQPVTTAGQSVALMLDKSRGLTLGPELVTNGDFSNSTTGWSASAGSITTVSEKLEITNTSYARAYQAVTLVPGKWYVASFNFTRVDADGWLMVASDVSLSTNRQFVVDILNASIAKQYVFQATQASLYIGVAVESPTAGAKNLYDNISLRELPGIHATQATAASRPIYSVIPQTGRRNLLTYSEQFDNAAWTKSFVTVSGAQSATYAGGLGTPTTRYIEYRSIISGGTANKTFTFSAIVSGSGKIRLKNTQQGVIDNYSSDITLTSTPTLVSFTVTNGASAGNGIQSGGFLASTDDVAFTLTATNIQFEIGSTVTAYQRVVSQYDVTEAGVATLHYLSFDGTDDFMVTNTITPGTGTAQMFAGVRKLTDVAAGIIAETTTDAGQQAGIVMAASNVAGGANNLSWGGGANSLLEAYRTYTAPDSRVFALLLSGTAAPRISSRLNGSAVSANSSAGAALTENFAASPLYIGRRAGTSLPFNGHLYGLIVRFGANLPTAQITQTERMLSRRTGFSAPQIDGTPTIGVTPL